MSSSRSEGRPSVAAEARKVLDGLWLGAATKPAEHLYPHQWSWDSAFIAIGNRHHAWDRAREELRSLFAAQWQNGMVPHIVFGSAATDYFPSPEFWAVAAACDPQPPAPTSGICQPPVHAMAVRLVYEARPDAAGQALVQELFPKLVAWHDYLHCDRAIDGPLVEIWHPWESGMDNSPAWDGPMRAVRFGPADVPPYRRVDTTLVDDADRPTDDDYDRYAYLVGRLRDEGYRPGEPRVLPFRVRDVLFNSALAAAEVEMAVLAGVAGVDPRPHLDRSEALAGAIQGRLWSEERGTYLSEDVSTGALIDEPIAGGLCAVLAPLAEPDRTARLVETMQRDFLVEVGDGAVARTVPATSSGFDATRYWRGPSWIQINWLLAHGLAARGHSELAGRLRTGIVTLVERAGFHEYFDPVAVVGHGTASFGWTAALYLDLVAGQTPPETVSAP